MTGTEIFQCIVGSGGLIGICFVIFRTGKIVQNIENIAKEVKEISQKVGELEKGQTEMRVQLGKLETRVEERTLRVIHQTKEAVGANL